MTDHSPTIYTQELTTAPITTHYINSRDQEDRHRLQAAVWRSSKESTQTQYGVYSDAWANEAKR